MAIRFTTGAQTILIVLAAWFSCDVTNLVAREEKPEKTSLLNNPVEIGLYENRV